MSEIKHASYNDDVIEDFIIIAFSGLMYTIIPFLLFGACMIITLNMVAISLSTVSFRGLLSMICRSYRSNIESSHASARANVSARSTNFINRLDYMLA